MIQLLTEELRPGMITAERIYSPIGQLLYEKETILTAQMIAHIGYYKVPSISILEEVSLYDRRYTSAESFLLTQTKAQQIRQSNDYKVFRSKFKQTTDSFHNALNDFILRSKDLDTDKLLHQTIDLFAERTTTISMFDMLHNMRQLDDSTYAHSINVALISRMIGMWLNYNDEDLNILTLCGILHDIGKSRISNQILLKPGKLDSFEFAEMQKHTTLGYELLENLPIDERIKNAALMHHERCDGSGYPNQLTHNQIDDFAAIVSIADVYEAMTANRCYRVGLCPFEVIAHFEQDGLQQYKPLFILTFLERIANTYIHNNVRLNNGITGEIVHIGNSLTRPMIQTGPNSFINLEERLDLYVQAII